MRVRVSHLLEELFLKPARTVVFDGKRLQLGLVVHRDTPHLVDNDWPKQHGKGVSGNKNEPTVAKVAVRE